MKAKILLSVAALASCLVACQNDEYLLESSLNAGTGSSEVIGADLVSHGMNIVTNGSSATTRVDANGWEASDQLGLAWYRFSSAQITDEQSYTTWNSGTWNYTYDQIYANHIFTYQGNGAFSTTTDVYQGAYFVYFPYKKLGAVKAMDISANGTPQTTDFDDDALNNALHISAQDFISANEAVDENNTLTKEFYLSPAVNVLKVTATPEEQIAAATGYGAFLKELNITALRVYADDDNSGNNVFIDGGSLIPSRIPKVQRDAAGDIDYDATREALDDAAAIATRSASGTATTGYRYLEDFTTAYNYIETTIQNPDFTLASANELRAFAFPIQNGISYADDEYPYAYVYVGRLNSDNTLKYTLGCFGVYNGTSETNTAFAAKLKTALSSSNTDGATSLTKILRNSSNVWSPLGLPVELLLNNLDIYTGDIKTVEQWNDLVSLYDAMTDILGAENVTPNVFNLTADVEFNGKIEVPNDIAITVTTSGSGKMTITGDVEWPENLNTEGNATIVIAEGATLVFAPIEAKAIDANITNNGTIKAGALASISTQNSKALDNSNGRVIVEYGAYVYPSSGNEGVIAYEVADSDSGTIGKINTLIATSGNQEYASVNTLIITDGTVLDLNASASSSDNDRYNPSGSTQLSSLSDIAIELADGSIVNIKGGSNSTVASVTAVSGDNTMTDVETTDITVESGATLNVTSATTPKTDLTGVDTLYNEGTIVFQTDATIASIENYGKITVASDYTVTYKSLNQINPTTGEQGSFTGNVLEEVTYTPDITEVNVAANDVKSAFTTLMANTNFNSSYSINTLDAFVGRFASFVNNNYTPDIDAFIAALNAWLEAYYGDGNYTTVTKSNISVAVLQEFETVMSYSFFN